MARRSQIHLLHLKEVCALSPPASASASASASALDLSDPSLLAALHPRRHSLALASASSSQPPLILVLASAAPRLTRIAPSLGESQGSLAALEWVPAPSPLPSHDHDPDPPPVLAVGTTAGYLLFYSLSGDLIHRQSLYPANILSLKFRDASSASSSSSSPELSIVFPGLIARVDASHIHAMLQKWSASAPSKRENEDYDDDDTSFSNLPFQLWNVNKFGPCADAAIVSLMPPPLLELHVNISAP